MSHPPDEVAEIWRAVIEQSGAPATGQMLLGTGQYVDAWLH